MTPDDLADYLVVPVKWVYDHKSQLPTLHVGTKLRFRRAEIDKWLKASRN